VPHVLLPTHPGKPEQPGYPTHIQHGLDEQRRRAPQQAENLLTHGARGAQRHEVAREQQTAIAVGGAGADSPLLDHAHRTPRLSQVMGAGEPDHPCADDQDIVTFSAVLHEITL